MPNPWFELALPLFTARPEHRVAVVQRYLDRGGNLDAAQRFGRVAIGMAISRGDEHAFDLLRTSGASLRFSARHRNFLIFAAAGSRNLGLARRLIEEFGFHVNATDECCLTPYLAALQAGDLAMAALFVSLGADTTGRTSDGRQAVDYAAAGGLVDWVRTHLEQQGLDELDIAYSALMQLARKNDQTEINAMWEELGCDPPPRESEAPTRSGPDSEAPDPWFDLAFPLFNVVPERRLAVIQRYLARGGSLDAEQLTGDVAIGMAVSEGDEHAFDVLRTSGASLRFSAEWPEFLIFAAAASHNLGLARRLVEEFGFAVNASNEYGVTPYLIALDAGDLPMATLFATLGADTTACTEDGLQAVHFAAGSGLVEVVRRNLEQHGLDELDTAHDSLMDVAVKSHQPAIIALLKEYGMEAPLPDEEETRPSPPQPISTIAFFDQLVRRFVRAGKVPVLDSMLDGHGRGTRMADLARFSILRAVCEHCGAGDKDVVFTMFFRHLPTGPPEEIKASYDAIIAMSKRVGDLDMAAECSARLLRAIADGLACA